MPDAFASMVAVLRDPEVVEELLRGLLRSIFPRSRAMK
jgi:hypothetical protein